MKNKNQQKDPFKSDRERNDTLNNSENRERYDLPGNYPASEDIMNRKNSSRSSLDDEVVDYSNSHPNTAHAGYYLEDEDLNSASEIRSNDIISAYDVEMDEGDVDVPGPNAWYSNHFVRDLDVPGSEMDDQWESIGAEDEENNYYSWRDDAEPEDMYD